MTDYTLDDAITMTVRLRKAVKWLENARKVKPAERPRVIKELDDPLYLRYQADEAERLDQIRNARYEIEDAGRAVWDLEVALPDLMPTGVWVLHEYRDRLFAIGLAKKAYTRFSVYALRIQLLRRGEIEINSLPNLASLRGASEFELAAQYMGPRTVRVYDPELSQSEK
jgi:hypothetical protein